MLDPRAQPLALVMLDLDGFKDYNDRHGHPAGDDLLRASARAISATVRDGDLCFRYGGDEFAIVLPRIDEVATSHVAEQVRGSIASIATSTGSGVTASVGTAGSPRDALTPETLVACADAALYRAKQAGGDRVETASGPGELAYRSGEPDRPGLPAEADLPDKPDRLGLVRRAN